MKEAFTFEYERFSIISIFFAITLCIHRRIYITYITNGILHCNALIFDSVRIERKCLYKLSNKFEFSFADPSSSKLIYNYCFDSIYIFIVLFLNWKQNNSFCIDRRPKGVRAINRSTRQKKGWFMKNIFPREFSENHRTI